MRKGQRVRSGIPTTIELRELDWPTLQRSITAAFARSYSAQEPFLLWTVIHCGIKRLRPRALYLIVIGRPARST